MNLRDTFRLLTPYTSASSYTLPELATIGLEEGRAFASDGISSISTTLSGSLPTGMCVKAGPVSSWLNTLSQDGEVSSNLKDGRLELSFQESGDSPHAAECVFPTAPLASFRVEVPSILQGAPLCKVSDTLLVADALSYVLKRSGTDSTFQWASGVTLAFDQASVRAYMTDNITMAMSACEADVTQERTVMITHGAAQRLQSLMASVPGPVQFNFEEGRLLAQVDGVVFATVTVADSAVLENFLQHVEPFSELETYPPSAEFTSAIQRHGQFAGREGEGTRIRVSGGMATIFTTTDSGRIKDQAPLGGGHPDSEVYTGASVLSRMLGEGSQLRMTEDAVMTNDPLTGNCALLCAWDDRGDA